MQKTIKEGSKRSSGFIQPYWKVRRNFLEDHFKIKQRTTFCSEFLNQWRHFKMMISCVIDADVIISATKLKKVIYSIQTGKKRKTLIIISLREWLRKCSGYHTVWRHSFVSFSIVRCIFSSLTKTSPPLLQESARKNLKFFVIDHTV